MTYNEVLLTTIRSNVDPNNTAIRLSMPLFYDLVAGLNAVGYASFSSDTPCVQPRLARVEMAGYTRQLLDKVAAGYRGPRGREFKELGSPDSIKRLEAVIALCALGYGVAITRCKARENALRDVPQVKAPVPREADPGYMFQIRKDEPCR